MSLILPQKSKINIFTSTEETIRFSNTNIVLDRIITAPAYGFTISAQLSISLFCKFHLEFYSVSLWKHKTKISGALLLQRTWGNRCI